MWSATTCRVIKLRYTKWCEYKTVASPRLTIAIVLACVSLIGCTKDVKDTTAVEDKESTVMSATPADIAPAIVAGDLSTIDVMHTDPDLELDSTDNTGTEVKSRLKTTIEEDTNLALYSDTEPSVDDSVTLPSN